MAQTLTAIRKNITCAVGHRVELTCRSRRKESKHLGVIEGAYASLFTVRVDSGAEELLLCYTYTDVLTSHVTVKTV